MKKVFLSELNLNDRFKFSEDGVVWTFIDVSPVIYNNSIRASSGRIIAPFSKDLLCFPFN